MDRTDTAGFLRRVLPRRGWLCAAKLEKDARWWRNMPVANVDELAARLKAINTAKCDAYMALAGYGERAQPHDDPAKAARGLTRFYRTQENARWVRSLWLDIDVKRDRDDAYSTRDAASKAITAFLHDAKLPWPTTVDSGYGFHLYWPFSVDLPQAAWHRAACALQAITQGMGLKADHGCTADASRVLRPVGTLNWKDPANPRPVELLEVNGDYTDNELVERLGAALQPFRLLVAHANGAAHAGTAHHGGVDAFDVSLPKSAEPIIQGCRQIREAAFQREDVWRGMLSVVRLCQHGDAWCHVISKRDTARYRREDTDAKLTTLARQQGTGGMPMTCAAFNEKRPGVCGGCPHRGAIRSPVVLGLGGPPVVVRQDVPVPPVNGGGAAGGVVAGGFTVPHASAPPARIEVPRLCDPRFDLVLPDEADENRPMGVAFLERSRGEDGAEKVRRVQLTRQPVVVTEAAWKRDPEGRIVFDYWTRIHDPARRVWEEVPLPGSLFALPRQLLPALYAHGLTLCGGYAGHERMVDYMRAYVEQVRRTTAPVRQSPHFGWASGDAMIAGRYAWQPGAEQGDGGGQVRALPIRLEGTAASVAGLLEPAGTLEDWKRAANLYARPGAERMAFVLFSGFAAPLLHFTDAPGFLVHLTGESGAGKTSLMRIAAAIWGNPQELVLHAPTSKFGDTRNALMAKIGVMHNLPLMFDELAMTQPEEVFPLVHALASGHERNRMTSTLDLKQGNTWKSIYVSAANRSLRTMLEGYSDEEHVAVLNRMMEVALPPIDPADRSWMADRPVAELAMTNYGHAGQVLAQWMVANAWQLRALIDAKRDDLMRWADAGRGERLWFAALAAIFVAAELAKATGLHDIDVEAVEQWVIEVLLPEQRRGVSDSRPAPGEFLAEFLTDSIINTIIARQTRSLVGTGLEVLVRELPPGGKPYVRYIEKSGEAFISRRAFKAWCHHRHVDYQQAVDDMKRSGQLVKEKCQSALARGLPNAGLAETAKVWCLRVRASPGMVGIEDEDGDSTE